jgi:hypothetical protein
MSFQPTLTSKKIADVWGGLRSLDATITTKLKPSQEEASARRGRHGAIDVEPLNDVLDRPNRLHATRRETSAADGQYATAAFVLAEHPDGAGVRGWDHLLEAFPAGGLERGNRLRVFLCDSVGPL